MQISRTEKQQEARMWLEEKFPRRVEQELVSTNTDLLYSSGPYFRIATDGHFSRNGRGWEPDSLCRFFFSHGIQAFPNVSGYRPQEDSPAPKCLLISASDLAANIDAVKATFDEHIARESVLPLAVETVHPSQSSCGSGNVIRPIWKKRPPVPEKLSDSAISLLDYYFGQANLGKWTINAEASPPIVKMLFLNQKFFPQMRPPSRAEIISFLDNREVKYKEGLSTYLKTPCDTIEVAVSAFNAHADALRLHLHTSEKVADAGIDIPTTERYSASHPSTISYRTAVGGNPPSSDSPGGKLVSLSDHRTARLMPQKDIGKG